MYHFLSRAKYYLHARDKCKIDQIKNCGLKVSDALSVEEVVELLICTGLTVYIP